MLNLVFLGPPGAGKGTVSEAIEKELGLTQISTGDLIRAEIKSGSKLGQEIKTIADRGDLVGDDIVSKLLENKLREVIRKGGKGVIFDGFPRNEEQAKMLDGILLRNGQKLTGALNLSVRDEAVIERLSNRRVCEKCKSTYNLKTNPPKKEGFCDKDGVKLVRRSDDNPETIRNRLKTYHEKTKPVIGYYNLRGKLVSFNANVPINQSILNAKRAIRKIRVRRKLRIDSVSSLFKKLNPRIRQNRKNIRK